MQRAIQREENPHKLLIIRYISLVTAFYLLAVLSPYAHAGETVTGQQVKPLFQLKTTPSEPVLTLPDASHFSTSSTLEANRFMGLDNSSSPLQTENNIFAISLGASYRFSDWLDIDATYSMPVKDEEINMDDQNYCIEAMVTMQF